MMYRFSSFVLALLLLVASGQVTATARFGVTTGNWGTAASWAPTGCSTATDNTKPANADAVTICSGKSITLDEDSAATVGKVTVETTATLDLGTKKLSAAELDNSGTVTSGAASHVIAKLTNTAGTMTLTNATFTAISDTVTYTAGTLLLPTTLTTITGLFTSKVNFTMPSTVTTLTAGVTVTGGVLTLSSANVVGDDVTLDTGGTIAGTLKFTSGDKAITATDAAKTIPTLDVSGMAANDTITINGNSVTFSSVYGGALKCLATGVTTDYTPGTAVAATGVCTVTIATSVPVFSTKELPKVFAEEVK